MKGNAVLTVSDIMTSAMHLKRADVVDDAEKLFHEYDVVPFPRTGDIKGFFHRDSRQMNDLRPVHLLSDATDALELPQLMTAQRFFFIISGNRVAGYVHYSDLNSYLMAIPLFGLFRTTEKLLWDRIQGRVSEEQLPQVFSDNEVKGFVRKREKTIRGNVDIGWNGIFSFPNILKLARHFGAIHETDEEIEMLREIRNRIAHSDSDLVNNYDEVTLLARANAIISSIAKSLTE